MAHISGHHKHVATPEDPATPKKGDGLWAFIVRSAFKGYLGAWFRENERVHLLCQLD
jgi:alkane 1-monooxygenase